MTSLQETKIILNKYNITANKKLGQNFLINDDVIEKIISSANIEQNDIIIEIGPGLGTLTKRLLEKASKVIAIEIDNKMINILNDRFKQCDNFVLINQDVLKTDLNKLISQYKNSFEKVKIVANLPYYITTPIIMKLLEEKLDIESITVMIQKEVAQRITADPGDKLSGAITYSVNYYAIPEEIIVVERDSFIPAPEVDSEVIKLYIRNIPAVNVINEKMFFNIIKASFMQRRKTLLNSLANFGITKDKEKLKEILIKAEIDENIRGERLTIEQFAKLSNLISKSI